MSDSSVLDTSSGGQPASSLKQDLQDARAKIVDLEERIQSMSKTIESYLENAVALKDAKSVLDEAYVERCEMLEAVAIKANNEFEERYNEKIQLFDDLKNERELQRKQEEIQRQKTLEDMKRVFDAMSAKVFEQESAHIDSVLKNVHTEREKQENLMKVLVEDFGTLDPSISSAIGDLRVQVANIKSSTEALSSTPLSAPPPPLQVLNTGPDAPRLLIQPKSFVILAYPEPTLNISNIQDFQSQLSTTSKKLNIHFKMLRYL
ncbi:hypothetical protein JTE90_017846 [Oedothorax gibbosus]|uniref:Uncharacterized protein n=1 Tax=Oedothorax gibbosus TaxID=931172 RepID=A0AAV6TPS1_9ARAC|nr:hypothetical protein JTE90_017846 [Oedothorax gibbosus]